MFKLSRKVEYALMATSYLQKHTPDAKSKVSVRDLSIALHIPFDTVSKVLQILNAKGVVGADKGVHGGYFIRADLSQITLYDFCHIIEQKELHRNCQSGPCEHLSSCNIFGPINGLNNLVIQFFKNISIQDLLGNPINLLVSEKHDN